MFRSVVDVEADHRACGIQIDQDGGGAFARLGAGARPKLDIGADAVRVVRSVFRHPMVGYPYWMPSRIPIPGEQIAEFCHRHHIRRLSLFGSVLRDDFRAESDVDVLVDFEPGCTPGFDFFGMQEELSSILGRRVDLNTPACLSRFFRAEVLSEAEVQFDKA